MVQTVPLVASAPAGVKRIRCGVVNTNGVEVSVRLPAASGVCDVAILLAVDANEGPTVTEIGSMGSPFSDASAWHSQQTLRVS